MKQDSVMPVQDIATIYFGGGTPSVLSLDEVEEILACFPLKKNGNCEISFECNPEDVTRDYLAGLLRLGITRISLGIQSLNDTTLQAIHRSNRESIFSALESATSAIHASSGGPISLNVDFILGLPHTHSGEILANIQELHQTFSAITHTSVYMLEDELYPKEWEMHSLSEKEIREDFLQIMGYFESLGWHHYELSNWAQPGYECRHNQAYWDHSEYRGFGLATASYEQGIRSLNAHSFVGYYRSDREHIEILTQRDMMIEELMFGLRTSGYIPRDALIKKETLDQFLGDGLLESRDGRIFPTKTGIFLLDYIMSELVTG